MGKIEQNLFKYAPDGARLDGASRDLECRAPLNVKDLVFIGMTIGLENPEFDTTLLQNLQAQERWEKINDRFDSLPENEFGNPIAEKRVAMTNGLRAIISLNHDTDEEKRISELDSVHTDQQFGEWMLNAFTQNFINGFESFLTDPKNIKGTSIAQQKKSLNLLIQAKQALLDKKK